MKLLKNRCRAFVALILAAFVCLVSVNVVDSRRVSAEREVRTAGQEQLADEQTPSVENNDDLTQREKERMAQEKAAIEAEIAELARKAEDLARKAEE